MVMATEGLGRAEHLHRQLRFDQGRKMAGAGPRGVPGAAAS